MLAGSRQHFSLHTLLIPKALTDKVCWFHFHLWVFSVLSLFRLRAFCFLQSQCGSDAYLHERSSESTEWRVVYVLKILELDHQWWKQRESHEHPIKEWESVLILPICKWQPHNFHEGHIGNRQHFMFFCECLYWSSYSWLSSSFPWLHIECFKGQCGHVHWCILTPDS